MLAWHFTYGMKLRDGTPLEVGRTYTIEGEPALCKYGFHASKRIVDAQYYCDGTHLCLVWCDGKIVEDVDKLVCQRRTVLAIVEVKDMFFGATVVRRRTYERAIERALLKYRKKQESLKRPDIEPYSEGVKPLPETGREELPFSALCAIRARVNKVWEKSVSALVMARILGT